MKAAEGRDPMWYRWWGRHSAPLPVWVVWLVGLVVLIPVGFFVGGIGIAGDLSDHQWQWQVVYAVALGLGWTGLCLLTRFRKD